jgi:hypothetical protein
VQGTGQQIRKGVQLHDRAMRDATSSARAGALGGALGAFGGILKGNRESTGSLFDFGKKGPGIF